MHQREGEKAIQGVLGFIGAFIKIIKMTNPTHVVALFDGEHKNDRAQLLPEYHYNGITTTQVLKGIGVK